MNRLLCIVCACAIAACGSETDPDDPNDPNDPVLTGLDRCLADGGGLRGVVEIDNNVVVEHGEITALALSADGQMALASSDGAIKLWSIRGAAEGTLAPAVDYDAAFGEDNPPIRALAYAPDGARIVSGRDSGEVAVWSAASGERMAGAQLTDSPVQSVDVSPDGARVAVANMGMDVRVWTVGDESAESLPTSLWGVAAVHYLSDGRLVTAGHDYGTPAFEVRAAGDPATVEWAWNDFERLGWVRAVATSFDGRYLAAAGDDLLLVIDLDVADAEPRFFDVGDAGVALLSVAFSPAGAHVIAADDQGMVRAWSVDTGEPAATLGVDGVVGVRGAADLGQLMSAERSGIVRLLGCGD